MPLVPLALAAGRLLVGAVAGKAVKKAATAVVRTVARNPITTTVATSAATAGVTRLLGRSTPPLLPAGFAPQGGPPVPRPREGTVGRTISRILPGGMTGREFTPYGDATDKYGRPVAVYPEKVEVTRGPKGYVMVDWEGERVAVMKQVAIKLGLFTPDPKPPVSGWDMRAIRRAHSARKRVKKLASKVGFSCASSKRGGKCK